MTFGTRTAKDLDAPRILSDPIGTSVEHGRLALGAEDFCVENVGNARRHGDTKDQDAQIDGLLSCSGRFLSPR